MGGTCRRRLDLIIHRSSIIVEEFLPRYARAGQGHNMATKLAHKRVSCGRPPTDSIDPMSSAHELIPDFPCQLTKEFQAMQKSPPPFIYARFDEKNILDCECSDHGSTWR